MEKREDVARMGGGEPAAGATRLTFLIADVRGYTSFTRERGDAAAAVLAKRFADLARDAVEARSGSVLELRGDEALAVFSSAVQAVRAAVEFQATCMEESRAEPAFQLPIGIGIDAGEAVPVEGGYRGVALNMAARLCSSATAGQVLVTRTVVDLAPEIPDVVFAERGTATFKGFEEPVEVIEALATARPGRPPAPVESLPPVAHGRSNELLPPELDPLTPLVDRELQMGWLRGTWRQVRRGRGRVLFVSGPSQIGKTRLAGEIAGHVRDAGEAVRYAGPGGAGTAIALSAIREAREARAPTLVVLDDIDVGGQLVAEALTDAYEALNALPVLVLALLRDPHASTSLSSLVERADERGDGLRTLGPLDLEGVRGIVRLYSGERADEAPVESMARASGGIPGKVHEVASDWARSEVSRRLAAAAEWLASGRDRRASDLEFANNVIGLKLGRLYSVEGRDVLPETGVEACPYRGLAPFEASDAQYFFGRERLVGELAARTVQSGLLAVVGPSGSGKSSLVAAGLLPSLAAGLLPGSERWRQASMRPGDHPVAELRRALRGGTRWEGSPGGAAEPAADQRLILLVDQFEELFTTCADEDERTAFVAALARVASRRDRATVVVALRSDFYGHCAAYPQLAGLLAENHVLVGLMTQDELRRAIELPARRAGLRIESSLVDALVADVAEEPGGLPLLSTALVELWAAREGAWIRLEAYAGTGGVRGAVARLAESAYEQLSDAQEQACRRVLLRLVAVGEGEGAVRRRVSLEEFDLERDPAAKGVIDTFTDDRLLIRSDGMVEVAHEAVLREWPRLRGWLDEDAQGRQLRTHITQSTSQWQASDREASELYRGARLSAALDWSTGHAAELNEREREFLAASRQASDRDAERQRRVNRRLRGLLVGVAVFLAIALVAGSLALVQRSRARASAARAQLAATVSLANSVGAEGINQPRLDRGLLLAREAVNLHVSDQTKGDLLATVSRNPNLVGGIYFGDTGRRPQRLALSPDGKTLAVSFNDTEIGFYDGATLRQEALVQNVGGSIVPLAFANHAPLFATLGDGQADVRLIDTQSFAMGRLIRIHPEYADPNFNIHVTGIAFSSDDQSIWYGFDVWPPNVFSPTARPASIIERYSVSTGRLLSRLVVAKDWQMGFSLTADGSGLVVVDQGAVSIYDARTERLDRTVSLHGFEGGDFRLPLALSPDGHTVAIGRDDGSVTFVSLAGGGPRSATGGHSAGVAGVSYSPDGSRLVTVGQDDRVVVWDAATGSAEQTLLGHGGPVHGVATDGRTIFTSSLDGTVFAWDLSQTRGFGHHFTASAGNDLGDPVDQAGPYFALSPDGRTLAAPEADGKVNLWDLSSFPYRRLAQVDAVPAGGIPSIAFSPDGKTLLATDLRGDVELITLANGTRRPLQGLGDPIGAAAFSPDGRLAAATDQLCTPSAGCSGHLALWSVATGLMVHQPMQFKSLPQGDVAFSPDGSKLAVPIGGPTEVIDVRAWKVIHDVQQDADGFATYSPKGDILATTGGSGLVRLWDTRTWKQLGQAFQISAGGGLSLSFDPTGHFLATAGTDGTVRIFDVANPALAVPFGPPVLPQTVPDEWGSAQFTPDGSSLVALDASGQASVWPMQWQEWAAHACAIAGRQLSRAEWSAFVGDRPFANVCPPAH
jgi:WD40 repeat protein/class 3 adenylate cyclase